MSGAVQEDRAEQLPETAVRGRSGDSSSLHRQRADVDEARPACPQGDIGGESADGRTWVDEWGTVPLDAVRGFYDLCENPECFGREWR